MKQEKIKRVYISGKITGLEEKEYTKNFDDAFWEVYESRLVHGSWECINPLTIYPLFRIKKWWAFMTMDLLWLRKCDYCVMQKNWIDSRGSVIEYFFAKFIFKHKIIFI